MNESLPAPPSDPTPSAGHETSDVNAAAVGLGAPGLAILVGAVLGMVAWTLSSFEARNAHRTADSASVTGTQAPPEPRLESDPHAALVRWREAQERKWSGAGPIDGESDVVRISVAEAMEILARSGFPETARVPESPMIEEHKP
jgi:hypothetical protein